MARYEQERKEAADVEARRERMAEAIAEEHMTRRQVATGVGPASALRPGSQAAEGPQPGNPTIGLPFADTMSDDEVRARFPEKIAQSLSMYELRRLIYDLPPVEVAPPPADPVPQINLTEAQRGAIGIIEIDDQPLECTGISEEMAALVQKEKKGCTADCIQVPLHQARSRRPTRSIAGDGHHSPTHVLLQVERDLAQGTQRHH